MSVNLILFTIVQQAVQCSYYGTLCCFYVTEHCFLLAHILGLFVDQNAIILLCHSPLTYDVIVFQELVIVYHELQELINAVIVYVPSCII